jgi:sugar lactone lactonase YvrE
MHRSNYVFCMILLTLAFCTFSMALSAAAQTSDKVIPVFKDNDYQLTGVAISGNNRLFVCYPYWLEEHKYSVVEVQPDGSAKPYPTAEWNSWKKGENGKERFVCAQAVCVDEQDYLWIVDPASPQFSGAIEGAIKLVKINLKSDKVDRIYYFEPSVAGKSSYINDVRIDVKHQIAYLTDSSTGAILILNLRTGRCKKVLEKHAATVADQHYVFRVGGRELKNAEGPVKIHSDGLALTPDCKYLYFKPLTDNRLFRIDTKHLLNEKLKAGQLETKVESLGAVCSTDGMICDDQGNLYLGDIENREIIRYGPDGKTRILLKDERLLWPDSYAISRDGHLFITCSQIHLMPEYNDGKNMRTTPYEIFKIKVLEEQNTKKKRPQPAR